MLPHSWYCFLHCLLYRQKKQKLLKRVRVSLFLSPGVFDPGIRELNKFMCTPADKVRPPRATGHCSNLPGRTCLSSSGREGEKMIS